MWQADGFTYEREAIEKWFKNHDISPKTGATVDMKLLIPNHSLRNVIRDFLQVQAQGQASYM